MADNHPEAALNLIKSWRGILRKEAEALSQGNIPELEKLFQKTTAIQQRLGALFATSKSLVKNKNVTSVVKDLLQEQGDIIESLKEQTEELTKKIGTLRKSKTSLNGYKQKKPPSTHFMSKRT
ncbi:MAG TPA: hypothetical protein VMU10_09835 [Desulfomonilia bacterium]|nr:hypothetical protein [Desulfomonilia bacterium]